MNFSTKLADVLSLGMLRNKQPSVRRLPRGTGFRPQFETLEERAVPTLNLSTDPFLLSEVHGSQHEHQSEHESQTEHESEHEGQNQQGQNQQEHEAIHMHVRLEFFLDGQQIVIPANVGVFGESEGPLHTEDSSGNIEIESAAPREFVLDDFLAVWNQTAQGHAALAKLEAAADMTVTVNGKVKNGLEDIKLHDHDTIIISAVSFPSSPRITPNQLFVTQLYADLLHRAPDVNGLATWTTDLDRGMSRTQVAQTIEANAEFMSVEVRQLYRTLLHRSADANGLAGFVAFLSGGGTIQQVENSMLSSPEFFQNAGGTNAGFISALYQDILQRRPDAAGLADWGGALAAGSTRDQLAGVFLQSQEAETVMLQAIYQHYLNRPADSAGLANFLAMLQQGGTREQVMADIMGSQEYFDAV